MTVAGRAYIDNSWLHVYNVKPIKRGRKKGWFHVYIRSKRCGEPVWKLRDVKEIVPLCD